MFLIIDFFVTNSSSQDLWSDRSVSNDSSVRTKALGFAYVGGVCASAYKYSVVEDLGGFASVAVIVVF